MAVAYKADIHLICDLVSKLLGMLPKETKVIYNKACRRMFIAGLFIVAQEQKQFRCHR